MLLTGGTGFLGAYLVKYLLEELPHATLHCLVRYFAIIAVLKNIFMSSRAADEETGMKRLVSALESYGLWSEDFRARITVLPGDIARDNLGLSPSQWDALSASLDAVVHNGAYVHWMHSYDHLKVVSLHFKFLHPLILFQAPNVHGTREIIRLCCLKKLKTLHYVSTTNVYDTIHHANVDVVYEDDSAAHTDGLTGGYTQTKWVAEQLVQRARTRGIPAHIYRPGYVTGDADTGAYHYFPTIAVHDSKALRMWTISFAAC